MSNSPLINFLPPSTIQTKKSPVRRITSPKTPKSSFRNAYSQSPKISKSKNDYNKSIKDDEVDSNDVGNKNINSDTKSQITYLSTNQDLSQDERNLISFWTEKVIAENTNLSNPKISSQINPEILPELIKNLQSVRDACTIEGKSELCRRADAAITACKNLHKENLINETSNSQTKNIQNRLMQAKQELEELKEKITVQEANMMNEFQTQNRRLKEKHKKEMKALQNEWFEEEEPLNQEQNRFNGVYSSLYQVPIDSNTYSIFNEYNGKNDSISSNTNKISKNDNSDYPKKKKKKSKFTKSKAKSIHNYGKFDDHQNESESSSNVSDHPIEDQLNSNNDNPIEKLLNNSDTDHQSHKSSIKSNDNSDHAIEDLVKGNNEAEESSSTKGHPSENLSDKDSENNKAEESDHPLENLLRNSDNSNKSEESDHPLENLLKKSDKNPSDSLLNQNQDENEAKSEAAITNPKNGFNDDTDSSLDVNNMDEKDGSSSDNFKSIGSDNQSEPPDNENNKEANESESESGHSNGNMQMSEDSEDLSAASQPQNNENEDDDDEEQSKSSSGDEKERAVDDKERAVDEESHSSVKPSQHSIIDEKSDNKENSNKSVSDGYSPHTSNSHKSNRASDADRESLRSQNESKKSDISHHSESRKFFSDDETSNSDAEGDNFSDGSSVADLYVQRDKDDSDYESVHADSETEEESTSDEVEMLDEKKLSNLSDQISIENEESEDDKKPLQKPPLLVSMPNFDVPKKSNRHNRSVNHSSSLSKQKNQTNDKALSLTSTSAAIAAQKSTSLNNRKSDTSSSDAVRAPISHIVSTSKIGSRVDLKSASYRKERRLRHYNRSSTRLRELRRQSAILLSTGRYEDAREVEHQADILERSEVESNALQMQRDYEERLTSLTKRHNQEKDKLARTQKDKKDEYEKAKKEALSVIELRIQKLEKALQNSASREHATILVRRQNSLDAAKMPKDNRDDFTGEVKSSDESESALNEKSVFSEHNDSCIENEGEVTDGSQKLDMSHSLNRNARRKKVDNSGLNRYNFYTFASKINKSASQGVDVDLNQSLDARVRINVNKSLECVNSRNPLAKRRRNPTAVSMPVTSRRQAKPAEFATLKLPPLNASNAARKVIKSNERAIRLNKNYM